MTTTKTTTTTTIYICFFTKINQISLYSVVLFQIAADGQCLYWAILKQMCIPATYMVDMFCHQIAHYMLLYPSKLYPYIQLILHDELLYEGWVQGILDQSIWGDESMLITISMMWNVLITVVDPEGIHNIHHQSSIHHIMLLANTMYWHVMHFSATGNYFIITHCKKKIVDPPPKTVSTQKKCPLFISVPHSYQGETKKLIGQGSCSAASLWINTTHLEPRKAAHERAMIMEQDFHLAQLQYKKIKQP